MCRTLILFWRIWFNNRANTTLFYLQKLPALRFLLPDRLYRLKHTKLFFSLVGGAISALIRLLTQSLLVWATVVYVPGLILGAAPSRSQSACLFLLVQCLAPMTRGSELFAANAEDHLFLNHFLLDPTLYYRVKAVKLMLMKVLPVIPALLFIMGFSWSAAFLALLKLWSFAAGNCLYLCVYQKRRQLWSQRMRLLLFAATLVLSYTLLYLGAFDLPALPSRWIVMLSIVGLLSSVPLLRFLYQFRDYKRIAAQFAGKDVISLRVSVSTPLNEDATSIQDSDWAENLAYFSANTELDPLVYMEQALRLRMRKVLSSYLRQSFVFNLAGGILLGILIRRGIIHLDASNIMLYSPALILVVTNMRSSVAYIPLCFRHMDLPLLNQHLLRPEMIVKSIKLRCIWLLKRGLLSIGSLILGIAALLLLSGIRVPYLDLVKGMLAYLFVFMGLELLDLSIYYLIQPYQSDLTTRSPLFSIYQLCETVLSWLAIFARNNMSLFLLPFGAFFAVAVVLLCLAMRFAPKTFQL